MVWTGTSTNQTDRATPGVLANDNEAGRKAIVFKTSLVFAAETNPVAPLFYVPEGFRAESYGIICEALSASAGVGLAADLGDAGDADRLAAALDLDAAVNSIAMVRQGAALGQAYTYTARTLINLTVTGVPVVSTICTITLRGTVPY
jgi:hypothetical protein